MKPALPSKLQAQLGLQEQSSRFTGGGKAYALKDRKARRKAARRKPKQQHSITTKPAAPGKHAHKRKVRRMVAHLLTRAPLLGSTGSNSMNVQPLFAFRQRMGFPLPAQGSRPRSSPPPQRSPVLWPLGGSKPRQLLLQSPELLSPAKQCSLTPFPAGRSACHALLSAGAKFQEPD